MRVMLINGLSGDGAYITSGWDRDQQSIGAFPPIGLTYIAGYLRAKTHHECTIFDPLLHGLDYTQIQDKIEEFKPDIVGTTIFTPNMYDCLRLLRIAKKVHPQCKTVVGGVQHLRNFLKETLSHNEIDYAVRGEGEVIFANLCNALENDEDLSSIEGLSYRDEQGQVVSVGPEGYIQNVDELPMPSFDLLPLHMYRNAIGSGQAVGTIASSRGCPYACTFCDRPYRSYRTYSIERIFAEMKYLYDKGVREYLFFDDMFNIKPKRVIEISQMIIDHMPDIRWSFRGRIDQISEEMISIAIKSGCHQMMFGIEVAKDTDLREIRKNTTTTKLVDGIKLCHKYGVETNTNWIIGMPCHKSKKDVLHLLDFAIKTKTDYAQFNILVPYYGTAIHDEGVKKGILDANFWPEYVRNPTPRAFLPYWNEYMTREELSKLLHKCYKKFYLRPAKVIANALDVRDWTHLLNKLRGLKILLGFGGFRRNKPSKLSELAAGRSVVADLGMPQ